MATKAPTKAQLAAAAKKAKQITAVAAPKAAATKKAAKLEPVVAPVNVQHLTHIVTKTQTDGFCYAPAEVYAPLVEAGLVDVNLDAVDETTGHHAVRSTPAADTYLALNSTVAAASAQMEMPEVASAVHAAFGAAPEVSAAHEEEPVAAPKAGVFDSSAFKVVYDVPMPVVARNFGPKSSKYPWETLDRVGASFFVAATDKKPNPAKSLASTVNSAMARYTVQSGVGADGVTPVFEKQRQFALRRVDDGQAWGFPGVAGAGIFRTK